jgi:hypothetical protein
VGALAAVRADFPHTEAGLAGLGIAFFTHINYQ